jgi:hypothetical protein
MLSEVRGSNCDRGRIEASQRASFALIHRFTSRDHSDPALLFTFNHLRPRLILSHAHGSLRARIAPQNEKSGPWSVLLFTVAFVFVFSFTFLPDCFRRPGSPLHCLLIFLIPFVGFPLFLSFGSIWALFGVEELIVQDGTLRWIRTALFWKRRFETITADISSVEAITPWHSLNNRVVFTAQGRRYTIGQKLLSTEARELASALHHALHLP